jgi:hypothetical protein
VELREENTLRPWKKPTNEKAGVEKMEQHMKNESAWSLPPSRERLKDEHMRIAREIKCSKDGRRETIIDMRKRPAGNIWNNPTRKKKYGLEDNKR